MLKNISSLGHEVLLLVQDVGLLIIAVATVTAVGAELTSMIAAGAVTIGDLLLLFIYLDSGKLPVRMPLVYSDCGACALLDSRQQGS